MIRNALLWPWSVLFGLALRLRHLLYDLGALPSSPGALPTVVSRQPHRRWNRQNTLDGITRSGDGTAHWPGLRWHLEQRLWS